MVAKISILRLFKAFEERFIWLVYLKVDPLYDDLRGNPDFEKLVDQMHLP